MKKFWIFLIILGVWIVSVSLVTAQQTDIKSKVEAYKKLGKDYWDRWLYEESEAEYKKAVELAPQDMEALMSLVRVIHFQGRYDDAIVWYKKVLEIDPQSTRALSNIAAAYLSLKEYKKAMDFITKTMEIEPNMPEAHCTLGEIYLAQGHYFIALEEFNKAIQFAETPRLKEYIQALIDKTEQLIQSEELIEGM